MSKIKDPEVEKYTRDMKEDEMFSDSADIIRHTTKIHTKDTDMTEDYVLFRCPDEKTEKFLAKQHLIADRVRDYIEDAQVAKDTSRSIRRECHSIAILKRNQPTNWLLSKLFDKRIEETELQETQGIGGKVMNTIFGKKQKKGFE